MLSCYCIFVLVLYKASPLFKDCISQNSKCMSSLSWFSHIVFLMSCGCLRSVYLPWGALGWSMVYDCDISLSYSQNRKSIKN